MDSARHIILLIFSAAVLLILFFSQVMALEGQLDKSEAIQNVGSDPEIQGYGKFVVDYLNLFYRLYFIRHSLPVPVEGALTFQEVIEANCSRKPDGDAWFSVITRALLRGGKELRIAAKVWVVRRSKKLELLSWSYL